MLRNTNMSNLSWVQEFNNSTGEQDVQDDTSLMDTLMVLFPFLGILLVLIFAANAFVIHLFCKYQFLRIATNLCLVFLAVSDLLAALVSIPLTMACNLTQSIPICTAMDLASRFIAINTVQHLLIVSLERWLMIVYPMHYHRIVNTRKVTILLVAVWALSLFIILIQLAWILHDGTNKTADMAYSFSTFFGLVFTSLCAMIAIYVHIFIVIKHQVKSIKKNHIIMECLNEDEPTHSRKRQPRGEGRAVIIFASMLAAFVLSWFPYFVLSMLKDLEVPIEQLITPSVMMVVRYCGSLVNPLLYTFFKSDFQKALRRVRRKPSLRKNTLRTSHSKA